MHCGVDGVGIRWKDNLALSVWFSHNLVGWSTDIALDLSSFGMMHVSLCTSLSPAQAACSTVHFPTCLVP